MVRLGVNILLVDDNKSFRVLASNFLTELGHKVTECENGQSALTELEKNRYHIILSDIRMPVMNGIELLREVKQSPKLKDIPIILITGDPSSELEEEGLIYGSFGYLRKPFIIQELVDLIGKISDRFIRQLPD